MLKRTKVLVLLLLLSPYLGELLSGSAPPLVFFSPPMFLLLVLLYGCGTVLIREAKVRWKAQWSVILLAVAYGIVEEGLTAKSFFNPRWVDLGVFSGYGMYLGTQWPWAIMLLIYHATISTLVPIAIVDLLWPEYKDVPLLGDKGIAAAIAGFTIVISFGIVFIGSGQDGKMIPYHPEPLLMAGSLAVVIFLIVLAYKYRNTRIITTYPHLLRPALFGLAGFLFQPLYLIVPNFLAHKNVAAVMTIGIQLVIVLLLMIFIIYQVYSQSTSKRHVVSLIFGLILFWVLLAPLQELAKGANPDPTKGMSAVGVLTLILLFLWKRHVLTR